MNIKLSTFINNKFAKDTIWLTVSQAVLILSGLLLNVVIDLSYGTETLGVFNQALGFYMILSSIFALGINSSIIHHISGETISENREVFSAAITVSFIATIFLSFFAVFFAYSSPSIFSSPEVQQGVIILLITIPLFNLNKNLMAFLTANRNQKEFSIFRTLRWAILITLIVIFTLLSKWKEGIYYAFLFTEATLLIILIYRSFHAFTRKIKRHQMKTHLVFGGKSFIAEVFSELTSRLDIVIIGYFLTQWEVGVFSFYIFFVKSLLIFPGILQQNINPVIVKHWKEKTLNLLESKLKKLRRFNLIISLLQLVMILIVYSLYTYYFRPGYFDSILFLIINCLAILPFTQIAWGGAVLVMTGMLRANIMRTALIAIFSITTLIVLSSFFGLFGTCIAVSLNMLFSFFMLRTFVQNKVGIRLRD